MLPKFCAVRHVLVESDDRFRVILRNHLQRGVAGEVMIGMRAGAQRHPDLVEAAVFQELPEAFDPGVQYRARRTAIVGDGGCDFMSFEKVEVPVAVIVPQGGLGHVRTMVMAAEMVGEKRALGRPHRCNSGAVELVSMEMEGARAGA